MSALSQYRVRSYQQEMFERSMQQNAIVVIDTGSGKTMIAALRIKAELERCDAAQMVWFLAPGVDLCRQQHEVLAAFLPHLRTRLLIGSDNVEKWSEQSTWDAALYQVRIVVSTHAILAQALDHAFVAISQLALIVFDEAHHCVKNHPANIIMQNHYHRVRRNKVQMVLQERGKEGDTDNEISPLPHILGLSASLVMKSDLTAMRLIESNMDCISVTPRLHRDELYECVNRPTCLLLEYEPCRPDCISNTAKMLRAAVQAGSTLEMELGLLKTEQLDKLHSFSAESRKHLRRFSTQAAYLEEMLGAWAADYYVIETVKSLRRSILSQKDPFADPSVDIKRSISNFLQPFQLDRIAQTDFDLNERSLSPKAQCLVAFLAKQPPGQTTCIIFVERRVVTMSVCHMLSTHPLTRQRFRCAPFVGSSNNLSRKSPFDELVDLKAQKDVLHQFRNGEINLLVATNALEEGIDVQSCNLVVCFDPPTNLKSFIQRRGRARQEKSTLAIMASKADDAWKVENWQALEAKLSRICREDRMAVENRESESDCEEEDVEFKWYHPETNALVTADSAMAHLSHFCSSLPPEPYIDHRPVFAYERDKFDRVKASVTLPSCLSVDVRYFVSSQPWNSERAARKDAAYQAYAGLYTAGLLNEHLLPLWHEWGPKADPHQLEPGQVEVGAEIDIWSTSSHLTPDTLPTYRTKVEMFDQGHPENYLCLTMITYAPISSIPSMYIGPDEDQNYCIRVAEPVASGPPAIEKLSLLRDATVAIDRCGRSSRQDRTGTDPAVLLQPEGETDLAKWLDRNCGSVPAEEYHKHALAFTREDNENIVRVPLPNRPPFVFCRWETNKQGQLCVVCRPMKRNDAFLSSYHANDGVTDSTITINDKHLVFLASQCELDMMDQRFVRFSLSMPRLFYHISDFTKAYGLRSGVLRELQYNNLQHTVTAIRAPCSNRETNYQRYEFVGDTLLKFVVSRFLYASQPCWPEGFLSKRRAHMVCNERLAAEALRIGLDPFIITEPQKRREWRLPTRPPHIRDRRMLPMKLLADVVEALIGATFFDNNGNLDAVRDCIHLLIPAVPSADPPFQPCPPIPVNIAAAVVEAENLIGRIFKQKTLLLEALTLSSGGSQLRIESYQRLEFLGDAVLDLIVMTHLLCLPASTETLSQGELTRLRACLVNAHLLGYFNLRFQMSSELPDVHTNSDTGDFFVTTVKSHLSLWHFLRHDSSELTAAQQECNQRYQRLSPGLQDAIAHGLSYPWEGLLALHPAKFYSDMIESIIGAIFVDSGGQLQPCEDFLARIGYVGYMRRLVDDHVDVAHPRDRLQHLLGSKDVKYNIKSEDVQQFGGELTVDGVVRACVNRCLSKAFAIAKLAAMGIEWFRNEQNV